MNKLSPGNPRLSWPEIFYRLAITTRPTITTTSDRGSVTIHMSGNDSAVLIEALDRLTREDGK